MLHDYVGCRTFEVPSSVSVGAVKELIYPETGFPVKEQCLHYHGREVSLLLEITYWGPGIIFEIIYFFNDNCVPEQ